MNNANPKQETFWSAFADSYDDNAGYVVGKDNLALIKQHVAQLSDLGVALELACGSGTYTPLLAKRAQSLIATDFSADMLAVAKGKYQDHDHIRFEQANALDLSYADAQFDSLFMANLLHVVTDPEQIIAQAHRVLKADGKIIILDFTMDGMSLWAKLGMIYRYLKTWGKPPKKARKLALSDILDLLPKQQFEIEQAALIGNTCKAAWVIACKK